jgi:hypothetical protein
MPSGLTRAFQTKAMMHIRVRTKKLTGFHTAIALLLVSTASVAQTPTQDQLNALKNLPQDQQSAIMQSVLGNGIGSSSATMKTDPRLNSPETVQPKSTLDKLQEGKTLDGRTLRQPNEDTELQPDDSVLLELTPVEETDCSTAALNGNGASTAAATAPSVNAAPVNPGTSGNTSQNAALAALGAASAGSGNNSTNTDASKLSGAALKYRCEQLAQARPKTDQERESIEKFRRRILASNPYKLNRFGVLEVPGLLAIPLDGPAERRPRPQRLPGATEPAAAATLRRRGAQTLRL